MMFTSTPTPEDGRKLLKSVIAAENAKRKEKDVKILQYLCENGSPMVLEQLQYELIQDYSVGLPDAPPRKPNRFNVFTEKIVAAHGRNN